MRRRQSILSNRTRDRGRGERLWQLRLRRGREAPRQDTAMCNLPSLLQSSADQPQCDPASHVADNGSRRPPRVEPRPLQLIDRVEGNAESVAVRAAVDGIALPEWLHQYDGRSAWRRDS